MTIDPRDYDVNELRGNPRGHHQRSHERQGPVDDEFRDPIDPVSPDEILRSGQYRDLFFLESAANQSSLEKPYLVGLPESYAGEIIIFEWLEFLFDKTGYRNAVEALRYYQSISWITSQVEDDLREYLAGMDPGPGRGNGELTRSDHVLSLMFVARLSALTES